MQDLGRDIRKGEKKGQAAKKKNKGAGSHRSQKDVVACVEHNSPRRKASMGETSKADG